MKNIFKKTLSFVLALAMVISMGSVAYAGESAPTNASSSGEITLGVSNVSLVKSNEEQSASIYFYMNKNATIAALDLSFAISDPDVITLGTGVPGAGLSGAISAMGASLTNMSGTNVNYDKTLDGYVLCSIPVTVSANAEGNYGVTITVTNMIDGSMIDYDLSSDTVTATITVEKAKAPAADYEVWYELSGSDRTDSNDDKYVDYDADDTVTATLYIKNNTNKPVSLQAYDLYLTYNNKLTAGEFTATGLGANAQVSTATTAIDGGKQTHIQAIGQSTGTADINIHLPVYDAAKPVETSVALGTIGFTMTGDAIYDEELAITLTDNSQAKAEDSTNVGVADYILKVDGSIDTDDKGNKITTGNKNAAYPSVGGTTEGAEIMTTYTVTYDANAGSDPVTDMPTENGVKQHNVAYTIASEPSRVGYTFKGWATSANAATAEYDAGDSYEINEALDLYAVWQKNTVTITWMNGETQYGEEVEIEYNTVPTPPSTNPSKADSDNGQYSYSFSHWATEDGTKLTTTTQITEDTTFYAVYTNVLRTYTVTWYPQAGGTALESDSNVGWGTKPSYNGDVPTKEKDNTYTYTFAGWADSANQESGTLAENLPAITGDTEYYAAFSKTERVYTVTFSDGTAAITGGYNTPITLPGTASDRTGYTFSGWNTVENPTTQNPGISYQPGESYNIIGDVHLYAQYTATPYTIILNPDGGNIANMTAGGDGNYTMPYDITGTETLPAATRTGYAFDGWKLEADAAGWDAGVYGANTSIKGKWGNVTLVAQWSEDKHEVKQSDKVENGAATPSVNSAKEGDLITVTVEPNTGYQFGANDTVTYSYTDANGEQTKTINVTDPDGDGIYSGTFTMPNYPVEITATFTAVDYTVTVTVDPVGYATVTPSKTTANIGDEITLTATNIKDGYKLFGYTSEDVLITDGKFTMPASNVGVTATFVGIDYTIKFDSNGGNGTMNDISAVYGTEYTPSSTAFTKTGYTLSGWNTEAEGTGTTYAKDAPIKNLTTTDGATVTLYAQWTPNQVEYKINYWLQNVGGGSELNNTNFTKQETDTVTKTATADSTITVAPEKDYTGFTTPANATNVIINADGTTAVDFYYTRNSYTITFKDGETTLSDLTITKQYGEAVTAPSAPSKDGYNFNVWSPAVPSNMPAENITISATWNAITYNITYKDGDTTLNLTPATYTIESTDILPTYSKTNYVFKGWKVTETVDGSTVWAMDAEFNADVETAVTNRYGNVTLTAIWDEAINYKVEDYKYGGTAYKMLRIQYKQTETNANLNYLFNEASMYYMNSTDGANYLVNTGDTGVFYTLIDSGYVSDGKLTEDGMMLITTDTEARATIDYDGKINDDAIVNIADANIVYQMIVNGGDYYSGENNLTVLQRLKADMHKESYESSVARATIEDVNAIVNTINGTVAGN